MKAKLLASLFLCREDGSKKIKIFFKKVSLLENIWHIKCRGMLATHINWLTPGLNCQQVYYLHLLTQYKKSTRSNKNLKYSRYRENSIYKHLLAQSLRTGIVLLHVWNQTRGKKCQPAPSKNRIAENVFWSKTKCIFKGETCRFRLFFVLRIRVITHTNIIRVYIYFNFYFFSSLENFRHIKYIQKRRQKK